MAERREKKKKKGRWGREVSEHVTDVGGLRATEQTIGSVPPPLLVQFADATPKLLPPSVFFFLHFHYFHSYFSSSFLSAPQLSSFVPDPVRISIESCIQRL